MAEKSLGYVNFDSTNVQHDEIEIRVPKDRLNEIKRGQYVLIKSKIEGHVRNFLARVTSGPLYVPDAVSRDSAFARASILQADTVTFRPEFHGVCRAQLMGEIDIDTLLFTGYNGRPQPQASALVLTSEQIGKLLGLEEDDMYLGHLAGYEDVHVKFPSDKNAALPRNLGIFGTVGSGKTNTSQVLIEEAVAAGWAVVVLDVEGEYVDMDMKCTQKSVETLFKKFAITAEGVSHVDVYHCANTEPAKKSSKAFGIRFANIDPYLISEIIDLSPAQQEVFLEIHSDLSQRGRKQKPSGFVETLDDDYTPSAKITLKDVIDVVDQKLANKATGTSRATLYVLKRRLSKLQRSQIFDIRQTMGDYSELLQPNKLSIIDLSGSYSSWINNILIVDLLKSIFKLKKKMQVKTNVMIVIEEAHSFISKDNAAKMEETLDVLREISRRGRKRWISLCFVSQQPSHLPPEIYELCNTKIIHQTTGERNLNAIKNSTGSVNPSLWDEVAVLGQGQCLFLSSYYKNKPILCSVRPAKCKRRFVDE